jgi:hypothetical protein
LYHSYVCIKQAASSPRGSIALASWTSEASLLTLSVARTIQGFTNISVNVPAATGIILPTAGVLPNERALLIQAEATNGNAAPVSVQVSDAVGSFLDSPRLSYSPGIAGSVGSIAFSFRAEMSLQVGEIVALTLAGFGGAPYASRTVTSSPSGAFEQATWDGSRLVLTVAQVEPSTLYLKPSTLNPQPSTLNHQPSTLHLKPSTLNPQPSTLTHKFSTLNLRRPRVGLILTSKTSNQDLPARADVAVAVPSSHAISLPLLGLQLNQLSLKVSTDASNGPVQGFSVSGSQADP